MVVTGEIVDTVLGFGGYNPRISKDLTKHSQIHSSVESTSTTP
jgi:hypothetical protein